MNARTKIHQLHLNEWITRFSEQKASGLTVKQWCEQKLELDHFAEMDTVHSSQESKRVILTFFLTREKLFLAFIMNRCTKGAVRLIFDKLEHQLGTYDFLTLFNTILTDRGSEFGDPDSLETGSEGIIRSSIYFCDPMKSGQEAGFLW